MKKKKIILPKLRYENAPEVDSQIRVGFEEDRTLLRNDDRDIVLDLAEQFATERAESKRYKLYGKMKMVFRNLYCGASPYEYLRERLSLSGDGSDGDFSGFLPYNEFAFLRNDVYYEVPESQSVDILSGFTNFNLITSGSTEHQTITTLLAPYFNWNIYLSYIYSHDVDFPMKYTLSGDTIPVLSFVSGNGIPFRVQETINSYILTSPVKHGMSQGEYIVISGATGLNYYYINSVGNEIYRSEEYVINILKSQVRNVTLPPLVTGKRCTDIKDVDISTSEYYVHRHKTLTSIEDYILDKVGFESPIWEDEQKLLYENSAGENDVLVVRNRMEAVLFDFKEPFVLSGITNNLGYTPTELYISIIFRNGSGYFNYPPKVGYSFHMHDLWIDEHFDGDSALETGLTYSAFVREGILFNQGDTVPEGTELFGAFVEYNPKDMKERIISEAFHKIVNNPLIFDHAQTSSDLYSGATVTNPLGILYQPHHRYKIRELSPYIESSDISTPVENLPENAIYFPEEKVWRWRDLYDDGYIDPDGFGTDYPYMNNIHYIHKNINFYVRNEQIYTNKKDAVINFYTATELDQCDVLSTAYLRAGHAPSPVPVVSSSPYVAPSPTPSISAPIVMDAYYVSPFGSDNTGDGSFTYPWYSLNKAWENVVAGNTIYMLGGTYEYEDEQHLSNKSGTAEEYINIWAYPGQFPVINPSLSYTGTVGVTISNANYIHIRGLDISQYTQRTSDAWYNGIIAADVNNCIFELLNVHHNGFGMSLQLWTIGNPVSGNLFLNCDFHHNYDSLTEIEDNFPYGGADGLTIRISDPTSINTIRGCRMYSNSDDGFDGWYNSGLLIFENCWSFNNGYREDGITIGGDGNGFKMGPLVPPPWTGYETQHKRTMYNCMAFNNRMTGFDQNAALCEMYFINNTSYNNGGYGFFMTYDDVSVMTARNNISFANVGGQAYFNSVSVVDHNTWDSPVIVTNADFISVNSFGTEGQRNSDGNLPILDFLKLSISPASDLIGAGIHTGLITDAAGNPWNDPPSMGAYEIVGVIPSSSPYLTRSVTPTSSQTPSVSGTPGTSITPTPTITPTISISRTPSKTASTTPTITPSLSISRTPASTISVTPTITQTPSVSGTPGASITPTTTTTPSLSVSKTPSKSPSKTVSITPSITLSISLSRTSTPTQTPTATITPTPSVTPTSGVSRTPTATPTRTPSRTPTRTPSVTPSTSWTTTSGYYYVSSSSGVDDLARNGSISQPWATLHYAISRVTSGGSTIYMTPGNYSESGLMNLASNVNIMGAGRNLVTVYITYSDTYTCSLKLETPGGWGNSTYGNQSISGIKFDGDLIGIAAIGVNFRSNVHIYDCEFVNFVYHAVWFNGQPSYNWTLDNPYNDNSVSDYLTMPDANGWCTGNKFYDNIVTNCAMYISGDNHTGAVCVGTQDGFEAYGNDINSASRYGYGIKFWDVGFNKNSDIHDNTIEVYPLLSGVRFEFAIEWWWGFGGDNFYNNRIKGSLDLVNMVDTISAGYSVRAYDNDIGRDSTPISLERGILLEGKIEYVQIYRNHIHHVSRAIYVPRNNYTATDRLFHVDIHSNLMVNLGQNGTAWQTWGIHWSDAISDEGTTSYFKMQNNVIHALPVSTLGVVSAYGIMLPRVNRMTNVYVENNIILNFYGGGIFGSETRALASNLIIRNNILFGNGYADDLNFDTNFINTINASGGYVYSGTIKQDPQFIAIGTNFHLSPTSPANYAGVYVGLVTDYDQRVWNNPPSIGAYEFVGVLASPSPSTSKTPSLSISRTPSLSISRTPTMTPSRTPSISLSAAASTGVYFVSATGNDSNNGTSESTPWQTLSKVNGYSFAPGNRILFKRGDTFRGYLLINNSGTSGNPIILDAYGTGNKPRIWGSKDYSLSTQWTLYSGNIWFTVSAVTTDNDVANLIFNNEESCGIKRTTLANCVAQGNWYINSTDKKVYLYSTSNPGTYYSHIEVGGAYIGATEEVIKINGADYITIRNLDVRYSPNNGIIFMYGCTHGIVEYCDVSWIGGIWVAGVPPYRMGNGIGVWVDADDIIIRYNYVHDCYDAGISPQGGSNFTQQNIQIYYNKIVNCYYSYEIWADDATVYLTNINFYNNTCVNATSWSVNQRPDGTNARHLMIWTLAGNITNCNIKNNIFVTCANAAIRMDDNWTKMSLNNNLYNVTTIGLTNNGTFTTLAQWQAGASQDANSRSGNPNFVSTTDFHLQSSSIAINNGVGVGLTQDFDGNAIVGNPDIGAYEYLGTPAPSASSSSPPPVGNYYYVSPAPTGLDSSGRNGSISQPWATLSYACTRVTQAGSVIYINAGTYNEPNQCILSPDVSIMGAGDTSLVYLRYQHTDFGQFCMRVANGTNTIGQSISYVKFSGDNLTGYQGILVYARSNVSIHHCTFENFLQQGVSFNGGGSWGSNTWKTGNSFYNNTVTNCAGGPSALFGDKGNALTIDDQQGFRCYNNTIIQPTRSTLVGVCIGGQKGTRDCKIYNNTITNPIRLTSNWNFAAEFHAPSGMEVYNNIITGEWDTGTVYPGLYSYGFYFHDNTIGWNTPQSGPTTGLQIEGSTEGSYVARNAFKNLEVPLYFCQFADFGPPDDIVKDTYVYCNLFYGIGRTDMNYGWGIRFESGSSEGDPPAYYNNIKIWHNTFVANPSRPALYGIELPTHARNTNTMNIDVRNNIIVGFSTAAMVARQQDLDFATIIDGISVFDNVFYGNGSNTFVRSAATLTNYTYDTPITTNPSLNGTYQLSSVSSPAYHAGTIVTFPFGTGDRNGVLFYNPPSIGTYEYI